MSQLLMNESAVQTECIPRNSTARSRNNPIADLPHGQVLVAAMCRLRACHNFEIRQLKCEVQQSTIIIHGRVSSYYLKQLAQETIRSLPGASRIINRLEVVYVQTNRAELKQEEVVNHENAIKQHLSM